MRSRTHCFQNSAVWLGHPSASFCVSFLQLNAGFLLVKKRGYLICINFLISKRVNAHFQLEIFKASVRYGIILGILGIILVKVVNSLEMWKSTTPTKKCLMACWLCVAATLWLKDFGWGLKSFTRLALRFRTLISPWIRPFIQSLFCLVEFAFWCNLFDRKLWLQNFKFIRLAEYELRASSD